MDTARIERILLTHKMSPEDHAQMFADDAVPRMFEHLMIQSLKGGNLKDPPELRITAARQKVAWRAARCLWNRVVLHARGQVETNPKCLKIHIPDWWLAMAILQDATLLTSAWDDWAEFSKPVQLKKRSAEKKPSAGKLWREQVLADRRARRW